MAKNEKKRVKWLDTGKTLTFQEINLDKSFYQFHRLFLPVLPGKIYPISAKNFLKLCRRADFFDSVKSINGIFFAFDMHADGFFIDQYCLRKCSAQNSIFELQSHFFVKSIRIYIDSYISFTDFTGSKRGRQCSSKSTILPGNSSSYKIFEIFLNVLILD